MINTVAVGMGGTGGWHALAWAIGEAASTGAHLAIYRVCPPSSPLAGIGMNSSLAQVELADPALARAVAAARTQLGDNRVTLSLLTGEPSQELPRVAESADLIVIGAPDDSRHHIPDAVRRVTKRAPCSVVVWPTDHGRTGPFAGHVVIGVDDNSDGHAALKFGFTYADRHRLPVAAVHISAHCRDDWRYDDSTLSTHLPTDPADLVLLATEVEPWHHKFPDVPVKRAVLAGPTVDGLLRAGTGSRLLIIGSQRREPFGRIVTGDVTRAVIDRARHPVAIMHVDDSEVGSR